MVKDSGVVRKTPITFVTLQSSHLISFTSPSSTICTDVIGITVMPEKHEKEQEGDERHLSKDDNLLHKNLSDDEKQLPQPKRRLPVE